MKRPLKSLVVISCLASSVAMADPLKEIFPWKPFALEEINSRVSRLTEEAQPMMNVYEMDRAGLKDRNTKIQPWGGYYWALNRGQIANTWQDKNYIQFWEMIGWENNVKTWKKRRSEKLPSVMDMSEKDLSELAPSEKYDLLLGDTSFDLTNRVWQFAESWGNSKKWGFLSSIEIPEGYRIPKANRLMALWEGICHGWAVAAGVYPRPEKTVTVKLPNGKSLPFYPDDIKALVSLMYANSILQDNVLIEGYRCDDKNPPQDEFGRFIDEMPKKEGEAVLPRCADVHPAIWHAALINITGIQGRSLITEIDANATVNNHPLSGYEFEWFNPKSGRKTSDLNKAVINLADYRDPYKSSRSPHAVKLVGVEMKMRFLKWSNPKDEHTNGPENDKIDDQKMMYDLELDAQGNIVGGQWRATSTASRYNSNDNTNPPSVKQPDFFWVVPKNNSMYVKNLTLEPWDGRGQVPASWTQASRGAHGFIYNMTREFGFNEKCTVIPENDGKPKEVPCEFKYPRPQPLVNVVNQLVEMSRE
ncbi:MAG: hypothetical protein ACLGG0_01480 [Bacteriovoracia bacterium]